MVENRQEALSELAMARKQLKNAETRVADLEAELLGDQSDLAAFQKSDDLYRRVLDSLQEGAEIIGFDWRYLYANDASASHGRQSEEVLLRSTVLELYPGIENTAMFAVFRKCMEERIPQHFESKFVFPDGVTAWFDLSVQPIPEGIFILSLDISERKRTDEHIRRLNRTLGVLSDTNQAIVRIRHLPALFESVCTIAVETGAFRMAWIGVFDPKTKRVNPVAQGGISDGFLEKLQLVLSNEPQAQNPLANCLYAGLRWVCNDLENDPQMLPWREEAMRLGYRSAAAWPLMIGGKVHGILNLYADEAEFFDDEELKLLDEMAMDISFAMMVAEQDEHRQQAEVALLESESRFRRTLDNMLESCEIIGFDWRYLYVNDTAIRYNRQTKDALLGSTVMERFPGIERTAIGAVLQRCMRERTVEHIENEYMHPDGTSTWFDMSVQPVEEGIFILSLDISERKRSQERLQRYAQRMEILHEIDYGIINAISIQNVIETALKHVRAFFDCQQAGVVLFDFTTDEVLTFALDLSATSALSKGMRYAIPPGFLEEFGANTISVIDDIQLLPENGTTYPQLIKEGMRAFLRALLVVQGRPVGVLSLLADRPGYFTVEDEEVAGEIAGQLAIAIRQMQLSEEVARHTADLEQKVATRTAELERQRTFLRNVIDVSPSMIFVKDYDSHFVLANPMVAKMYNTTVDALIGKSDADFNPSAMEVDSFLAADRQVITSGESLFIEEPVTNALGETHWLQTTKVPIISADGKSSYVLGVSTDLTERKRAEAALKESEVKYRSLIETMRGGLAIFDVDGRISYVNDRFCELLGYRRDELLGTKPHDYVDESNAGKLDTHLEQRRHVQNTSYEIVARHKDGRPVHLLVSGSPLLDKNGGYSGSFSVTTDITAQKQAEETLRQALATEKELGELKSRFVSMASHEFRTPLATILALTETLKAYRLRLTEEQIEQRLGKIQDQVGHLKDIMDDVLQLARIQARRIEFNPVKLDLDAFIRSVIDEFQSRPDVTHPIEYTYSSGLPQVTLDRRLMRQIVSNLLSNAIKYSPAATPIKINLEYASGELVLRVKDEGIGIPEADLKHLFEPFHRAANVGAISGTGLGLVITKEAVDLHNGAIEVESQLGVGTTFVVKVPVNVQKDDEDDEIAGK